MIETFPIVDGEPFPTLYWLTCARAVAAVGRLEAEGLMREINDRLAADPAFASALGAAQRDYVERRDALHRLEGAGGVGGGPLDRVKCLHAHYAHHLVSGANPVGTIVVSRLGTVLRPPPCVGAYPLAAIDVGTNTVRLLVADAAGEPVERALEITRLGQGVDAARRLAPEAISRTAAVVGAFAARARELGAVVVRVVGTSALRDAANSLEFAREVYERAGLGLGIPAGAEEGRLSFLGATSWLHGGPFVVCDIGGGSTELVTAQEARSADIGSVRLRERCLVSDPPAPSEIAAARELVGAELERIDILTGDEVLVGVAGTITTLAALVLDLERYDHERVHGARLSASDVATWSERLLGMPVAEIRALPSMHPGRADVIASGVLVLREVVDRWGFREVLVSERDFLDGLVLDLRARGR